MWTRPHMHGSRDVAFLLQVASYLLDRGLRGVDGVVFLDSKDHKFVWPFTSLLRPHVMLTCHAELLSITSFHCHWPLDHEPLYARRCVRVRDGRRVVELAQCGIPKNRRLVCRFSRHRYRLFYYLPCSPLR